METLEFYDRSEWRLCLEAHCPRLFDDGCLGPSVCVNAIKRVDGVQIYMALPGCEAEYVTTQARKH